MITEDYCSYELSKLLKEKGFDGLCYTYYPRGVKDKYNISMLADNHNKHSETSRPTLQMAMKWLREEHKLFIDISFQKDEDDSVTWFYMTWAFDNRRRDVEEVDFTSYEEAVEAAIKYSLENLI